MRFFSAFLSAFNPFKGPGDLSHIVVPLEECTRRHSSMKSVSTWSMFSDTAVHLESHELTRTFNEEVLTEEIEADMSEGERADPYERKMRVLNLALRDIGVGAYQWRQFFVCGSGWLNDNMWLSTIANILPQLGPEFGISRLHVKYTLLAFLVGMGLGASFWSMLGDRIGRRIPFYLALVVTGIAGLCASAAESWTMTCIALGFVGFGAGGSLPVDGAVYMESLPSHCTKLIVLLAAHWSLGGLISSFSAWGLVTEYSCELDTKPCPPGAGAGVESCCRSQDNRGWRYNLVVASSISMTLAVVRFFFFRRMVDSPKSLLARGKEAEAVHAIHVIAHYNGVRTWLTEDVLIKIGEHCDGASLTPRARPSLRRNPRAWFVEELRQVFRDRKLGMTVVLVWFIWLAIGMGYPLYNGFLAQYLAVGNATIDKVYLYDAITTIPGVFGPILAYFVVDFNFPGRKWTMVFVTAMTCIFVLLFSLWSKLLLQLVFGCVVSFFQNIMYAVLFAYTLEFFPARIRGTGTGIAGSLNRLAGIGAPLVAIHASRADVSMPLYLAGGLFAMSFIMLGLLRFDTRGMQVL